VHLVGFIIRIYHDARSPERQRRYKFYFKVSRALYDVCVCCGVCVCVFVCVALRNNGAGSAKYGCFRLSCVNIYLEVRPLFSGVYKRRSHSGKMTVGGGSVGVSVAYVSTEGLRIVGCHVRIYRIYSWRDELTGITYRSRMAVKCILLIYSMVQNPS